MKGQRVSMQRNVPAWCSAVLVLLVGVTPGCVIRSGATRTVRGTTSPGVQDTRRGTVQAEPLDDDVLTQVIGREVLLDDSAAVSQVDVTTDNGVVTLDGQVDTLLARARLERIAQTVKGVRRVKNRIDVVPAAQPDEAALEHAVVAALALDAGTDALALDIDVDHGAVMLRGTVPSVADRMLAERVAAGVRGVSSVENRIEVRELVDRSSEQIRRHVEERLRNDALVRDGLIRVNVDDDEVALSGVVRSAAERTRAQEDAWVPGVRSVDASALQVEWWLPDDAVLRGKAGPRSDREIAQAVRDALWLDARAPAMPIRVDVTRGVVTLGGSVDYLAARFTAERLARSIAGVVNVRNQVEVRPRQALPDDELARRARTALRLDAVTSRHDIAVSVHDGKVTLSGTVDSFFEMAKAEDVVARLRGPRGLEIQLEVADMRAPYVYNPYVAPYEPLTARTAYVPPEPLASDTEIRESIVAEMAWSPFVDESRIAVRVDDGRATLTGTAGTPQERTAAIRSALLGGAVAVAPRISVAD